MTQPTFESASYAEGLTLKFADEGPFSAKFFTVSPGRRYDRIMAGSEAGRMDRIHAFVERETGHVFKAAGLRKPADHVRYTTVDSAIEAADLHGSYLYIR